MTTEELLALPENGVRRLLIRGELREEPMTYRNPRHSKLEAAIARILGDWLATQPEPRGDVLSGEAGFRILRGPDTTVGIDVAYISAELAAQIPENARIIEGSPILAVEILSPSDTQQDITDKIRDYLEAKVKLIWVVEPVFRTITVYRPDAEPELFNIQQQLKGDLHLPGLVVDLKELFRKH
jgi:Uma2 family endonuclease